MLEKQLVSLAEIVQSGLSLRRFKKSVLGTLSVAGITDFATQTVTGKLVPLVDPKIELLLGIDQIRERCFGNIAQKIFGVYKMIT